MLKSAVLLNNTIRPVWRMTKPTIGLLVIATALPGLIVLPASTMIAVLFGIWCCSASAAIVNQLVEKDRDMTMQRTCLRALPQRSVSPWVATVMACTLLVLGSAILCVTANHLTAGIAVAAHLFYVVVYTIILKPLTAQNIVIGGAAGAVGPLLGEAAVSGHLNAVSWILFAMIFLWTPPHFWALAIKYRDDYKMAGIPMLPGVKGVPHTKGAILLYSVALFLPVLLLVPYYSTLTSIVVVTLTAWFFYYALRLYREPGEHANNAMPLFHYSCGYLFLVFGAYTLELLFR